MCHSHCKKIVEFQEFPGEVENESYLALTETFSENSAGLCKLDCAILVAWHTFHQCAHLDLITPPRFLIHRWQSGYRIPQKFPVEHITGNQFQWV